MTKEQEVIKYIKTRIKICNENADICDDNDFDEEATYLREESYMLETVLSMLKENSAEIEKKNTELAEKNAEIEKLKKFINYLQLKNIKDLDTKIYMANFINDNTPYTKDTKELENEEGIRTVDFTVKYFERKATKNG